MLKILSLLKLVACGNKRIYLTEVNFLNSLTDDEFYTMHKRKKVHQNQTFKSFFLINKKEGKTIP